jgi:hypothetical protein
VGAVVPSTGRGELKGRKLMGDSHAKLKVKDATPPTTTGADAQKDGRGSAGSE